MWRLRLLHHFFSPFFLGYQDHSDAGVQQAGSSQPECGMCWEVFPCKLGFFLEHSSSLNIQGTRPNRNNYFCSGANVSLPQNFRCHIWMCIYKIFTLNRDNLWNSTGWALLNIINFAGQPDVFMYNFHRLQKPFSCSILFAAQKCLESAQQLPEHPKRCQAPSSLCKSSDCLGHATAVPTSHLGSCRESNAHPNWGSAWLLLPHQIPSKLPRMSSFPQSFHKALGAH